MCIFAVGKLFPQGPLPLLHALHLLIFFARHMSSSPGRSLFESRLQRQGWLPLSVNPFLHFSARRNWLDAELATAGHLESIIIAPVMLFFPMPLGRLTEPFNHPDWIFETRWRDGRLMLRVLAPYNY